MKKTEKFPKAGYKIHFDRLRDIRAKASFIRTHKFKCEVPFEAETELKNKFNALGKVVDSSEEGSLIWFLVQMYGLGFLFVSKESFKNGLLEKLYPDHSFSDVEDMKAKLKDEVREKILQNTKDSKSGMRAMFDFLTTTPKEVKEKIKENFLPAAILRPLKGIFLSEAKKEDSKQKDEVFFQNLIRENEFLRQYHDNLKKKVEEKHSNEKFGKADLQSVFLKNGNEIKETDTKGTTFVIQKIPLEEMQSNFNQGIDIYLAYFKYLMPASLHTGRSLQSLAGAADKQNGLSNFLNSTLKEFTKGKEEAKELIRFGNQLMFADGNNKEILDFLSEAVHELAKRVNSADKADFLKASWHEYRSLIGGRLGGWLSNFDNRLADYESALADNIHEEELKKWGILDEELKKFFLEKVEDEHHFVFREGKNPSSLNEDLEITESVEKFLDKKTNENGKIKSYFLKKDYRAEFFIKRYKDLEKSHVALLKKIEEECDIENIFPDEIKKAFDQIKELQPILLKKLREATLGLKVDNADKRGLGECLDEYRTFLQIFREFLMVWENEGVDKLVFRDGIEQEIKIFEGRGQKPEKFWISRKLLKKKDDSEKELDEKKLGFLSRDIVPAELKKYPAFLGQAKKTSEKERKYAQEKHLKSTDDEQVKIFNARFLLLDFAIYGSKFCSLIEKNKDDNWEERNWPITQRKKDESWEEVYHFGALHKALESLRKIACTSRNTKTIIEFLNEFVKPEIIEGTMPNEKFLQAKADGFPEDREFRFFVSGREYRKNYWKEIPVIKCSLNDFLSRFENKFGLSSNMESKDFERFFGLFDNGVAKDVATKGELLKLWWSLRMKALQENVELRDLGDDLEDFIKKWVSLESIVFDQKTQKTKPVISRKMIHRFLQSGFGAEIRGKIALISRGEFIERNVLQVTNGEQSVLRYVPREWGDFSRFDEKSRKKVEKRNCNSGFKEKVLNIFNELKIEYKEKTNMEIVTAIFSKLKEIKGGKHNEEIRKLAFILAEIPHSWEMVLLTRIPLDTMCKQIVNDGFFIDKSKEKEILRFSTDLNKNMNRYSFPIVTSRYQKQFLEKFLFGDFGKEIKLIESMSGSSLILEQKTKVAWKGGMPEFQPVNKDGFAMYVALPFVFNNNAKSKYEKKMEIRNGVAENGKKILGIDLGEYGFGWAILDPTKTKNNMFEASGFMEIPLLQKMREQAKSWKDTQSRGIFSRPTTYLAEIREQAAGQTRNQIHRLALEFSAIPVYEDSVDAFESGGKRIEKLYKTLKTADVIGGNASDADKALRKHIWGLEYAQIGGVIGAAKTSQTCRNCGRCATSELRDLEGEKITVENSKIKGTEIACNLSNGSYDKKGIEKTVKNAQRFESDEEKAKRQSGKKGRGTVEKFKCQICGNETDADEQAAKNIALKYYLKLTATDSEKKESKDPKTGNFSSLKFFLKKSPQYKEPTN